MPKTPSSEPSQKQKDLLYFIVSYLEDHGYQPSQAEMAVNFKVTRNAITGLLDGLVRRGLVELPSGDKQRALGLPGWKCQMAWVGLPTKGNET
jgi:SOS-response transcriptional repressor LexA